MEDSKQEVAQGFWEKLKVNYPLLKNHIRDHIAQMNTTMNRKVLMSLINISLNNLNTTTIHHSLSSINLSTTLTSLNWEDTTKIITRCQTIAEILPLTMRHTMIIWIDQCQFSNNQNWGEQTLGHYLLCHHRIEEIIRESEDLEVNTINTEQFRNFSIK